MNESRLRGQVIFITEVGRDGRIMATDGQVYFFPLSQVFANPALWDHVTFVPVGTDKKYPQAMELAVEFENVGGPCRPEPGELGYCLRWDDNRGFGFLRHATLGDVFCHISQCLGTQHLVPGLTYEFTPAPSPRQPDRLEARCIGPADVSADGTAQWNSIAAGVTPL